MKVAGIYSELSHCVRLKVGAIIVKRGTPIAIGYNGMPNGEENVCELADGTTNPRVRHAEINALRKLIRSESNSEDSIMFLTHSPCPLCSIEIFESGIKAVFFETPFRDEEGLYYLCSKGVKVFQVNQQTKDIFEYNLFYKKFQLVKECTDIEY